MPKKQKKGTGLGKTLIKEHGKSSGRLNKADGWLHTSELSDGYDWGRLNLASVTEESSLDEFLRTAELAGTEFTAEKLQISVVGDTGAYTGLPCSEELRDIEKAQQDHRNFLSIPRRPSWDSSTTTEELELKERESFLQWRRHLAALQENDKLTLTPFEKNLEFWRQLWRVIERSDLVVQIVDARNPLLFRCEDLEMYVKELDPAKKNLILMSKSDLLTAEQRASWLEYFQSKNIEVAFWSAKTAGLSELTTTEEEDQQQMEFDNAEEFVDQRGEVKRVGMFQEMGTDTEGSNDDSEGSDDGEGSNQETDGADSNVIATDRKGEVLERTSFTSDEESVEEKGSDDQVKLKEADYIVEALRDSSVVSKDSGSDHGESCGQSEDVKSKAADGRSSDQSSLLSPDELLEYFRQLGGSRITSRDSPLTVGLVGYPNVGKSSTINALLGTKKVPVSATPGRTKHFQTLYAADDLVLCDCPGLVFPNFVTSKADMICNGVLPIDQMRDHIPPVSLVCSRIPRQVLEATYGISIPSPKEGEDPHRPPYAHELLSAYGYMRGFMTVHGMPDQSRSARCILKDYVNGNRLLLYCEPPPGVAGNTYNTQLQVKPTIRGQHREEEVISRPIKVQPSKFDKEFFRQTHGVVHSRTVTGTSGTGAQPLQPPGSGGKPWKKHNNRHRKEKTRRIVGKTNPYDYY